MHVFLVVICGTMEHFDKFDFVGRESSNKVAIKM